MSIFKKHKTNADRSASDRRRHREKIEKAIKDGIHEIVAEESIIGQNGKKKFKIPVKGIKEFRFVYGNNNRKGVASAPGKNVKKGDVLKHRKRARSRKGDGEKASKEAGEEFYEVEITLEELAKYLFDDLNLPDLKKKSKKLISHEQFKRKGYRKKGIRPRLDKKKSIKNKIKRKIVAQRNAESLEERFPFHESDLRYRYIKKTYKETSSAVIFFLMDISGSMTKDKKYIARSFFFLLYHFINMRYKNTEIIFIAHEATAKEVSEEQFFKRGSSGGTIVSSALELTREIINKRFNVEENNFYIFHASDGDNFQTDNEKALELTQKLKNITQLYGFCEIEPMKERFELFKDGSLTSEYLKIIDSKFKVIQINAKEDIWPGFLQIFGNKK